MSFVENENNLKLNNRISLITPKHNYYKEQSKTITVSAYARLSRDEDRENYSSIEEQINIIKEYAKSRGWDIADENVYIDDNVSGYTFDRPKFAQMLENVSAGKIDVVIAKDLSRIGRNNEAPQSAQ